MKFDCFAPDFGSLSGQVLVPKKLPLANGIFCAMQSSASAHGSARDREKIEAAVARHVIGLGGGAALMAARCARVEIAETDISQLGRGGNPAEPCRDDSCREKMSHRGHSPLAVAIIISR